ncbi:MAG: alkaline phosphatase family protein, partial [Myxococcota bacterium]|nr:alkaline phosphatase family protein [Myxococcota bacterium]
KRYVTIGVLSLLVILAWVNRGIGYSHYKLANQYMAEGKSELAATHYQLAKRLFHPKNEYLDGRRGMMLLRSGQFKLCVSELWPTFATGKSISRHSHIALWECLIEEKRYEDASKVVRQAMGKYENMTSRCAGVLALLERKMQETSGSRLKFKFSFDADKLDSGNYLLAGNWTPNGKASEVLGWNPTPMHYDETSGSWQLSVDLESKERLPYIAMVFAPDDNNLDKALAMSQFWPEQNAQGTQDVKVQKLNFFASSEATFKRQSSSDNRSRTFVIWPDAGSWFLIRQYMHRGLLPNIRKLIENGVRGEMVSTHPPYTSTAYMRMVYLDSAKTMQQEQSVIHTLMLQLKGIPFLDKIFPDNLVVDQSRDDSLFHILRKNKLKAINLVFNDKYIFTPDDGKSNDGTSIEQGLKDVSKNAVEFNDERRDKIIQEMLGLNLESTRAVNMLEETSFLLSIQNTQDKAEIGKSIWTNEEPDFLLLRFPAVDILSHKFFKDTETDPEYNLLLETYLHLDRVVGQLAALTDTNDNIIFASDHGIEGTLKHHPACLLVVTGPGAAANTTFDTMPISHFPVVILSQFAIKDGSERLSANNLKQLYGDAQPRQTTQHAQSQ